MYLLNLTCSKRNVGGQTESIILLSFLYLSIYGYNNLDIAFSYFGITDKFKKKLKPYLSNLPSHSLNFVQNHSESQYNAVSDFLKNKETGTSIEKDTIIDKIKDILVKAKQTDENNVVTDETARSISDKLVKDGKITNIKDVKTDTSSFTINRDTFEDAQENALKRARQLLENTRQNYEKTELNIRRVEQDMPMLG